MVLPTGESCLQANSYVCAEYLRTYSSDILAALRQHVTLTLAAVGLGLLLAVPAVLLVRAVPRLRTVVLGVGGVLYSIPSLALFVLIGSLTGSYLSLTPVVVALGLYNLQVLVRNALVGLDEVPADARDAALGTGYDGARLLLRVELPLALPSIITGLRIATVSTIALVTVGTVLGAAGMGTLIYSQGIQANDFHPAELTGFVGIVLLGLVADLLLLGLQRLLTPWTRARAA